MYVSSFRKKGFTLAKFHYRYILNTNNEMSRSPVISPAPVKKEQVCQRIHRAAIAGEFKPGEILNEAEITAQFDSGKTPTRETLLLLTHEGYSDEDLRLLQENNRKEKNGRLCECDQHDRRFGPHP
jgi:hypothetical protein